MGSEDMMGSDGVNSVRTTQLKVIKGIAFSIIVLAILSVIFLKTPRPVVLGLFFGGSVSCLLFLELGITLTRAVKMSPEKAQKFAMGRYFLRFTVMAIVLYVSIGAPHIHFLGTAVGLIIIKPVIYATHLFNDKQYFKNIIKRKEDESDGR